MLVEFTLVLPLTLLLELELGLTLAPPLNEDVVAMEALVGLALPVVEASGNVDGGIADWASA